MWRGGENGRVLRTGAKKVDLLKGGVQRGCAGGASGLGATRGKRALAALAGGLCEGGEGGLVPLDAKGSGGEMHGARTGRAGQVSGVVELTCRAGSAATAAGVGAAAGFVVPAPKSLKRLHCCSAADGARAGRRMVISKITKNVHRHFLYSNLKYLKYLKYNNSKL